MTLGYSGGAMLFCSNHDGVSGVGLRHRCGQLIGVSEIPRSQIDRPIGQTGTRTFKRIRWFAGTLIL